VNLGHVSSSFLILHRFSLQELLEGKGPGGGRV